MTKRRLKHWGWGYEDQSPTAAQLTEAAEGIRAYRDWTAGAPEEETRMLTRRSFVLGQPAK